jgi:hypothetical protein
MKSLTTSQFHPITPSHSSVPSPAPLLLTTDTLRPTIPLSPTPSSNRCARQTTSSSSPSAKEKKGSEGAEGWFGSEEEQGVDRSPSRLGMVSFCGWDAETGGKGKGGSTVSRPSRGLRRREASLRLTPTRTAMAILKHGMRRGRKRGKSPSLGPRRWCRGSRGGWRRRG